MVRAHPLRPPGNDCSMAVSMYKSGEEVKFGNKPAFRSAAVGLITETKLINGSSAILLPSILIWESVIAKTGTVPVTSI